MLIYIRTCIHSTLFCWRSGWGWKTGLLLKPGSWRPTHWGSCQVSRNDLIPMIARNLPTFFRIIEASLTETAFDFFYRTSLTRSWEYQSSRNQRIFLYLILKFWSYQIRLSVSSQKVVFCTLYDSYDPVSVPLVFHFCGEIWLKISVFTTEAFLQVSAIWWSCEFPVPAMPDRGVASRGIFSYRCHFGYLVGWTMGTTWNHSLRSYKAWKS